MNKTLLFIKINASRDNPFFWKFGHPLNGSEVVVADGELKKSFCSISCEKETFNGKGTVGSKLYNKSEAYLSFEAGLF